MDGKKLNQLVDRLSHYYPIIWWRIWSIYSMMFIYIYITVTTTVLVAQNRP